MQPPTALSELLLKTGTQEKEYYRANFPSAPQDSQNVRKQGYGGAASRSRSWSYTAVMPFRHDGIPSHSVGSAMQTTDLISHKRDEGSACIYIDWAYISCGVEKKPSFMWQCDRSPIQSGSASSKSRRSTAGRSATWRSAAGRAAVRLAEPGCTPKKTVKG